MVGGSMMAVDRRSTGAQVDDQTIELRASSAVTASIGDRGHVNATSYNRVVLLTGEVPSDADRSKVEAAVAKVENVRAVLNELAVMPNSSLGQRSDDSIITGKVKAAFVDTKDLQVGVDQGRHRTRRGLPDGPRHRSRGHLGGQRGAWRRRRGRRW